MDLRLIDWAWYIPTWDGNRDRARRGEEAEPVRLEIKGQSYGDVRGLAQLVRQRRAQPDPADDDALDQAYFIAHVRAITGLRVDGTPIPTGAALWALRAALPPALFTEIWQAIQEPARLAEGLVDVPEIPLARPPCPPKEA